MLGLGHVEARRRLVEQAHVGSARDRPRELEQSALTVREPARRFLGELAEPDPLERVDRDGPPGSFVTRHSGRRNHDGVTGVLAIGGGDEHVLDARQVVVGLRRLVRAQHADARIRPGDAERHRLARDLRA